MLNKRIPVGVEFFGDLIRGNYAFVDKTLLIKELIDNGSVVTLITRPRRWGKTLNLTMLQHFFAKDVNGKPTEHLFDKRNIGTVDNGAYMAYQGKYPVIFITLKDIKEETYDQFIMQVKLTIKKLYRHHESLLDSDKLKRSHKEIFQQFYKGKVDEAELGDALRFLSEILYRIYNQKVVILIDEYDTPLNNVSSNPDELKKITDFMRKFLGAALKTNPYLEKGVMTGIVRLAKANIFSQLNNLSECSVLDESFSRGFGFTKAEVRALFTSSDRQVDFSAIQDYYNGYQIGQCALYNPWSIINCLSHQGKLGPYWVGVSDNALIKNTLKNSTPEIKQKFEQLLQGEAISVKVDKYITYEELNTDPLSVWSLLVHTGYLTVEKAELDDASLYDCSVRIPNREVRSTYVRSIREWFSSDWSNNYSRFINHLITGNIEAFKTDLQEFLLNAFSYFDVGSGKEPKKKKGHAEQIYHAFVLGLVADLYKAYRIKSNREAGTGRYDVVIVPLSEHSKKLGIVFEFKSLQWERHEFQRLKQKNPQFVETQLKLASQQALAQIKTHRYAAELEENGVHNKLLLGIAFAGKKLDLVYEKQLAPSFDAEKILFDYESLQPVFSKLSSGSSSEQQSFVQKIFGEVTDVVRQVKGRFQDEDIVFDVYRTKGDGHCGFYGLPIPHDRKGVVDVLHQHGHTPRIRELVAPEIMEACRTRHLPHVMREQYQEFEDFCQQEAEADISKADLLRAVLDVIDSDRTKLPDRRFENVIVYLQHLAAPTDEEHHLLHQMQGFQQRQESHLRRFKQFCTEEYVFRAFVQYYVGGQGQLSFNVGGLNFNRETSFLDAILEFTYPPIQICIWEALPNHPNQVQIVYQGGRAEAPVTHLYHHGGQETHFELMADSNEPFSLSQSPSKLNDSASKRDQQQYDPTLFASPSKRQRTLEEELAADDPNAALEQAGTAPNPSMNLN